VTRWLVAIIALALAFAAIGQLSANLGRQAGAGQLTCTVCEDTPSPSITPSLPNVGLDPAKAREFKP
jgi:hypothetical protein